jgi:hypothetical protein
MRHLLGAAGRGVVAGLVATTAMSLTMAAFQSAGLMGRMPPRRIVERVFDFRGRSKASRKAIATILHFAFGALAGGAFETVRAAAGARLPRAATLVYAMAIYASSYAGWVPAIGALPPPGLDRPGRQPAMIAAHLVYGAVLRAVLGRSTW